MTVVSAFLSNAAIDALRPFVTVDRLSSRDVKILTATPLKRYAVLIADNKNCCSCRHGQTNDDFSNTIILFRQPKHLFNIPSNEPYRLHNISLLCFNESLCNDQKLPIDSFTFFKYSDNEALHCSKTESCQLRNVLDVIAEEQYHDSDNASSEILSHLVATALYYCQRFYQRQFIVRQDVNKQIIKSLKDAVEQYYTLPNRLSCPTPPPTTSALSKHLGLSPQYLEDLVRHETGLKIDQYIKLCRTELAEKWLQTTTTDIETVARRLGFSSKECLNSIIEKTHGVGAEAFRMAN